MDLILDTSFIIADQPDLAQIFFIMAWLENFYGPGIFSAVGSHCNFF